MPNVKRDTEELRIALVMNGGVSLAVWIGGVTSELGRLLARCPGTAYRELCELTATQPRIDVIAGTSAGGVNGAYLALALAYHEGPDLAAQFERLRTLWVDKGSFSELLRSPFERQPRSLLDGDGYYLSQLREAFEDVTKLGRTTSRDAVPIELILTTTLLKGASQDRSDDFGSPIVDVSHRARLHFSRHRRRDGEEIDDFKDKNIAARLALAARCTSSFPAAFEPSLCPTDPALASEDRPSMADHLELADRNGATEIPFTHGTYVLDGGILDNKPLDVALEEIFKQRAVGPVRRVLAYVVPDPGASAAPPPASGAAKANEPMPDLLAVVLASLVEIPSVQSIAAQIDALRAHNKTVLERRQNRVLLTRCYKPRDVERLAGLLFEAYRERRIEAAANYVVDRIEEGLVQAGGHGFGHRGRREWLQVRLRAVHNEVPWIPQVKLGAAGAAKERAAETWRWGTRPVEHAVRILLDVLVRAQQVARLARFDNPEFLKVHWNKAFQLLNETSKLRGADDKHWRSQAPKVQDLLGGGTDVRMREVRDQQVAESWLKRAMNKAQELPAGTPSTAHRRKESIYTAAGRYAHEIAADLVAMHGLIGTNSRLMSRSGQNHGPWQERQIVDLKELYGFFVRAADEDTDAVVERLLAFEVVEQALGNPAALTEEEVDFIQVSAESLSGWGGPSRPGDKLAGVQLAHFGAFYKHSWRANDWMWGRLDAVKRIVTLMLDPERVRLLCLDKPKGARAAWMLEEIQWIALGPEDGPAYEVLKARYSQAELLEELAYLDQPGQLMPERLSVAVEAVSRRIELEILQQELPQVARAIDVDEKVGSHPSDAAIAFRQEIPAAIPTLLDAARAALLLSKCGLGRERIHLEVGTDHLTVTASQTAAVTVAAISGQEGWAKSVGRLLASLRTPLLMFYLFARNAQYQSPTGLAFNVFMFTAGLAVVIISMMTQIDYDWLVAAGWGALIAGGLLLTIKLPPWGRAAVVVAAVALVIVLAVQHLVPSIKPEGRWGLVAVVEFLLLVFLIFGHLLVPRNLGMGLRSRGSGKPAANA
jgi:patatin-related protein